MTGPRRRTGRRVLTPIVEPGRAATFLSPVRNPGGPTRLENWHTTSRDGLWSYERIDDVGTLWRVTYVPTGQTRDGYASLPDARAATAGELPGELRAEALRGAVDVELANDDRARAQRWLGWYLREAVNGGADLGPIVRCQCGGLLVEIGYRGADCLVHVDACRGCWTPGAPGFAPAGARCEHRVCGEPSLELVSVLRDGDEWGGRR